MAGMKDKLKAKAREVEEDIEELEGEIDEMEEDEEEEAPAPKKSKKGKTEKPAEKPKKEKKAAVTEDGVDIFALATEVYAERNPEDKVSKALVQEVWKCMLEALPEALFMNGSVKLGSLGSLIMDASAGREGTSVLTPKLSKEDIAAGKTAQPVEKAWKTEDKWVAKLRMSPTGEDLFAAFEESTGDSASDFLASLKK